jgi:hypothetical protein
MPRGPRWWALGGIGTPLGVYSAYANALGIKTVRWAPSGSMLAVGSYDCAVRLLNSVTLREVATHEHTADLSPSGGGGGAGKAGRQHFYPKAPTFSRFRNGVRYLAVGIASVGRAEVTAVDSCHTYHALDGMHAGVYFFGFARTRSTTVQTIHQAMWPTHRAMWPTHRAICRRAAANFKKPGWQVWGWCSTVAHACRLSSTAKWSPHLHSNVSEGCGLEGVGGAGEAVLARVQWCGTKFRRVRTNYHQSRQIRSEPTRGSGWGLRCSRPTLATWQQSATTLPVACPSHPWLR